MKKRYNVYLDVEATETVQAFLERTGHMSFSAFVNTMMRELAQSIKGQPSSLDKPASEMTIKEFGEVMNYWFKQGEETESEKM